MPLTLQRPADLLLAAAIFALVFALWMALLLVLGIRRRVRSRRIEERLGLLDPAPGQEKVLQLWLDDRVASTTVLRSRRRTLRQRIEQLREGAGWSVPTGTIIGALTGATLLTVVVVYAVTGSILPGAGCGAGVVLGFWFYLKLRIGRRTAAFERQFVDALDLAARSLRAGHPLLGAFRLISEEIAAPVGTVFSEICQQQALGMSLDQALQTVAVRSSSDDVRLFATSVTIQLRSGGNLAQMMDRLAYVIRDRLRLCRRVRILTAQTQFSKRLLVGLPVLVFLAMHVISPEYSRTLYETSDGRVLLTIATGGLLLGAWVMNRLAVLHY